MLVPFNHWLFLTKCVLFHYIQLFMHALQIFLYVGPPKYIPSIFDKVVSVVVSYFFTSHVKDIQAWYEFSWFLSRVCPEFKEYKCNYSVAHNLNISAVIQLWQTLKCFKNCDASEVIQLWYILNSIFCGVLKLITGKYWRH